MGFVEYRIVEKCHDVHLCGRYLHHHNLRGFYVRFYLMKQSSILSPAAQLENYAIFDTSTKLQEYLHSQAGHSLIQCQTKFLIPASQLRMKIFRPETPREVLFLALFLDLMHVLFQNTGTTIQIHASCYFPLFVYINAGHVLEFICTCFFFLFSWLSWFGRQEFVLPYSKYACDSVQLEKNCSGQKRKPSV